MVSISGQFSIYFVFTIIAICLYPNVGFTSTPMKFFLSSSMISTLLNQMDSYYLTPQHYLTHLTTASLKLVFSKLPGHPMWGSYATLWCYFSGFFADDFSSEGCKSLVFQLASFLSLAMSFTSIVLNNMYIWNNSSTFPLATSPWALYPFFYWAICARQMWQTGDTIVHRVDTAPALSERQMIDK